MTVISELTGQSRVGGAEGRLESLPHLRAKPLGNFRQRIATLLLILGSGLLIVHLIDSQRSMLTMLIATLGILVFMPESIC